MVQPLSDICTQALKRSIPCINFNNSTDILVLTVFGDIPYPLIYPILQNCTPAQLLKLEAFNPVIKHNRHLQKEIISENEDIWKHNCKFIYKIEIKDKSWRNTFILKKKLDEDKVERVGKMLRGMNSTIQSERHENSVIVINASRYRYKFI